MSDSPAFPDVRSIAVLRGGGLGDLIMTLPALTTLHATYPTASLTLLGTAQHARLLAGRPGPVDDVLVLPDDGVALGGAAEPDPAFLADLQRRGLDLAVQLHGGGRWSNPFLLGLGARHTVGSRTPDSAVLERWLPHSYYQHEALRALEVVSLAGAVPGHLPPALALTADDLATADPMLDGLPRPLLAVHPGATDPRRRWPADRFASVTADAIRAGAGAVVLGDAADRADAGTLVDAVRGLLPPSRHGAVRSLAGRPDESALCGVLTRCTVLLGNDSGPRHLADAVGTATVSVYWAGNMINTGPIARARHRVHIGWTTYCPVCGHPCVTPTGYVRCAHDPSFVDDVPAAGVSADVLSLLAGP